MKRLLILFTFIVSDFIGFSQDYCEDIIVYSEETLDKVVSSTPTSGSYIIRIDENDETRYFVGLQISAEDKRIRGKLAELLLEDGTKILVKANEIDVYSDYESGIYYYSTFIEISMQQMRMLANRRVVSFKIGSLLRQNSTSNELREYAKCLLENR